MINFKVDQKGVELRILAEKLGPKVLHPIIAALAERAETLMREKAPRRTGRLIRSIHREVRPLEAWIGPRVPYAIYVEYGTRPHEIRPVHARALRFEVGGQVVFAAGVQHPGTRPQPFVRETAEKVRSEADEALQRVWREAVQ